MHRSNRLHDELDVLLDGRLGEVSEDLAPLLLAPATIASASSLPGDTLYPVKLAVEKIRLATAMWSSTREAGERTRVADERLEELNRLVDLSRFSQVPPAIRALNHAVVAAQVAVREAMKEEGTDLSEVAEVAVKLNAVEGEWRDQLVALVQT